MFASLALRRSACGFVVLSIGALLGLSLGEARAQQDITYEAAYQKLMEGWKKSEEKLTYDQAMGKGDEAWSAIRIGAAKVQLAEAQAEKDAAAKEIKAAEVAALQYYKITLAKAPAENEENQNTINENRDRVAYLAYQTGAFAEAATVGEYLARKFPADQFATHAAQIATASYLQNYNKAKPEDKGAVLTRLVDLTAYIAETWKDKPEGADAMGRLAQYAMAAGNVDQAKNILNKLPKDSEHRYALMLRLAQGTWYEYVKAQALAEDKRPTADALEKMKADAKANLRTSTEWIRAKNGGQVDYPLIAGELSLVQIYNQLGEFDAAKKVLEIPKTGLMELARLNLEVIRPEKNKNLREEIYKSAMRTYLGLKDYPKAEVVVTALSSIGGKGVDAAAMTRLFASLAKQVVEELTVMRKNQASAKEIKTKLDTLTGLLEKVVERKEGHTFGTLSWPAQTFFDQAEILREQGGEPAGPLYEKAIAVYEEILKRAKDEKDFAQASSLMAVRENIATCHRNVGHHKEALVQFLAILKEYPTRIKSQIEAAQTLQDLAKLNKDSDLYDRAMKGSNPEKPKDGKGPEANVIWGWGKIALMTQDNKQNQETFYTARYNLTYCRLMQAMLNADEKKKTDGLRMAENDVRITYTLNHTMGGDDWRSKFNDLLKAIQQAQGKEAVGLPKKEETKDEPKKAEK